MFLYKKTRFFYIKNLVFYYQEIFFWYIKKYFLNLLNYDYSYVFMAFRINGCRTIGRRTIGLSDYQVVGLSGCRTIGLSDYRAVWILGLEPTPIPPSITILLDTIIYMHMHIQNLVVCINEKNPMENPVLVLAPFWTSILTPPPPRSLSWVWGFFCGCFCFCFFKILLRIKINSLASVYMKINFLVELCWK